MGHPTQDGNIIERMAVISIADHKTWIFLQHLTLDLPVGVSGCYLHFAHLDSHQTFEIIKRLLLHEGFTPLEEKAIKAALRSEVDCIRFLLGGE